MPVGTDDVLGWDVVEAVLPGEGLGRLNLGVRAGLFLVVAGNAPSDCWRSTHVPLPPWPLTASWGCQGTLDTRGRRRGKYGKGRDRESWEHRSRGTPEVVLSAIPRLQACFGLWTFWLDCGLDDAADREIEELLFRQGRAGGRQLLGMLLR